MRSLILGSLVLAGCGLPAPHANQPTQQTAAQPQGATQPVAIRKTIQPPPAAKPKQVEAEPEQPVLAVTALQLRNDYEKDLAAADERYLGKVIIVTEVRGKLDKTDEGTYFFGSSPDRLIRKRGGGGRILTRGQYAGQIYSGALNAKYVPGILMAVASKGVSTFKGVKETDSIAVQGRCKGMVKDSTTVPAFFVLMADCKQVSLPASGKAQGK